MHGLGQRPLDGASRGFRKAIVCRASQTERRKSLGKLEIESSMAESTVLRYA
jgi:hypothetical protein